MFLKKDKIQKSIDSLKDRITEVETEIAQLHMKINNKAKKNKNVFEINYKIKKKDDEIKTLKQLLVNCEDIKKQKKS